ncbi:alpha/beta fold hydrolase [Cellulomonas chengniuliangii]|uniref:Alpha/beta fold hydrolase n=1 Tax=Cellulomonas chengniuliangii TaxID=2968084 RepID=A0ABY5L1K1_9CELL|nr:alpha/beta fold hydrolase [Cellulomonas chengniuliangii]UUI75798.1 alpha/beta fold hydrolase [Cellulomonas chengniuliangii]
MFVHGMRTSSSIWDGQVAAMTRSGHRAHAVDLPGHGARVDERFTLDAALETIDRAVTACPTPPLLVGLSLGGYISLAYAAGAQHKLAGAVLAGCSTELRGKPIATYRRVSNHVTRALGVGGDNWGLVSDMLGALTGYSSLEHLRTLRLPVWLVNGMRDPLRMDERRYLATLPTARLTVVPRAGHDVNSHAPTAFNRILLDAAHRWRPAAVAVLS